MPTFAPFLPVVPSGMGELFPIFVFPCFVALSFASDMHIVLDYIITLIAPFKNEKMLAEIVMTPNIYN